MTEQKRVSRRGFAGMDPERQRELAKQGGTTAALAGATHRFTQAELRHGQRRSQAAIRAKREQQQPGGQE